MPQICISDFGCTADFVSNFQEAQAKYVSHNHSLRDILHLVKDSRHHEGRGLFIAPEISAAIEAYRQELHEKEKEGEEGDPGKEIEDDSVRDDTIISEAKARRGDMFSFGVMSWFVLNSHHKELPSGYLISNEILGSGRAPQLEIVLDRHDTIPSQALMLSTSSKTGLEGLINQCVNLDPQKRPSSFRDIFNILFDIFNSMTPSSDDIEKIEKEMPNLFKPN